MPPRSSSSRVRKNSSKNAAWSSQELAQVNAMLQERQPSLSNAKRKALGETLGEPIPLRIAKTAEELSDDIDKQKILVKPPIPPPQTSSRPTATATQGQATRASKSKAHEKIVRSKEMLELLERRAEMPTSLATRYHPVPLSIPASSIRPVPSILNTIPTRRTQTAPALSTRPASPLPTHRTPALQTRPASPLQTRRTPALQTRIAPALQTRIAPALPTRPASPLQTRRAQTAPAPAPAPASQARHSATNSTDRSRSSRRSESHRRRSRSRGPGQTKSKCSRTETQVQPITSCSKKSHVLQHFAAMRVKGWAVPEMNAIIHLTHPDSKVYAVGDLDGRLQPFANWLLDKKLIKTVEGSDELIWTGDDNTYVIQCGDQIDGVRIYDHQEYDLSVMLFFEYLRHVSKGHVLSVIGNHEMINALGAHYEPDSQVANGIFRYVHSANTATQARMLEMASKMASINASKIHPKGLRSKLFEQFGLMDRVMLCRPFVARINNALFSHAGVNVRSIMAHMHFKSNGSPEMVEERQTHMLNCVQKHDYSYIDEMIHDANSFMKRASSDDIMHISAGTDADSHDYKPNGTLADVVKQITWNRSYQPTGVASCKQYSTTACNVYLPMHTINVLGHNKVFDICVNEFTVMQSSSGKPEIFQDNLGFGPDRRKTSINLTRSDEPNNLLQKQWNVLVDTLETEEYGTHRFRVLELSGLDTRSGRFTKLSKTEFECKSGCCQIFDGLRVIAHCVLGMPDEMATEIAKNAFAQVKGRTSKL